MNSSDFIIYLASLPQLWVVLVGVTTQLTGKTNAGVLSIIVLFIIGGFLLTRVPENNTSVTPPSPKTKTL